MECKKKCWKIVCIGFWLEEGFNNFWPKVKNKLHAFFENNVEDWMKRECGVVKLSNPRSDFQGKFLFSSIHDFLWKWSGPDQFVQAGPINEFNYFWNRKSVFGMKKIL